MIWLRPLLERVAAAWIGYDQGELASVPPGHGTIRASAMPGLVREAYEDLVPPGFDEVGIDSRDARAWLAQCLA